MTKAVLITEMLGRNMITFRGNIGPMSSVTVMKIGLQIVSHI